MANINTEQQNKAFTIFAVDLKPEQATQNTIST